MTTPLHEERLQAVMDVLHLAGARSVADLGCGDGALLLRLLDNPEIEHVAGLEQSTAALTAFRASLAQRDQTVRDRVTIIEGSMLDPHPALAGYDAVAMVETIEHLPPDQLSRWAQAVFGIIGPKAVVITTPNAEYNAVLGVPPHRFRHPEHLFEWDRARFRQWAEGIAARHGQRWLVRDIAGVREGVGGASQMAIFLHPDLVI